MDDFEDVAALGADAGGDVGEYAGAIGDFHQNAQQAAIAQEVAQQGVGEDARIDIAAANGQGDALAFEALGEAENGGEAGRPCAFGDEFGVFDQHGDGLLDHGFGDDEDFGVVGAQDGERQAADIAHGDAFGDGGAADRDGLAGEGLGKAGIGFDFDAEHLHMRGAGMGGDGAAGDEAAAAGGDDQGIEIGLVGDDFEGNGGLARDDCGVVIGVDEDEAFAGGEGVSVVRGFGEGFAVQHDFGAPGAGAHDFGGGGEAGHDDGGGDAREAGMASDRLGVIARRHGDDAAGAFGGGEQRDTVGGAAFFEGTGGLEIFEFQENFGAGGARQGIRMHQGGAQDRAFDAAGGGIDIGEAGWIAHGGAW